MTKKKQAAAATFELGAFSGGPVYSDELQVELTCVVDLDILLRTRLLAVANSGGGKSWVLRRILEQTHGRVQQIVIDPEDEFHTLREKYDYVIAGRDGADCQASVKSAALLARRLLETGASAIIGLFELPKPERIQFVAAFCEALVDAPKELWHPLLLVIDEAHVFCPQGAARTKRGMAKRRDQDESDCANAVIDLATRGRKRGFCVAFATTRVSKLDKDATAECNNKLIGRIGQDLDAQRAGDELGFTTREQRQRLRNHEPGTVNAFGPAINTEVVKVKVGGIQTSHPQVGQRAAPPAPPRAAIKKLLAEFADLPAEAAEEARTVAELQKRVRELERDALPSDAAGKADLRAKIDAARAAMQAEKQAEYERGVADGRRYQSMGMATILSGLDSTVREAFDVAHREHASITPPKAKPNGTRFTGKGITAQFTAPPGLATGVGLPGNVGAKAPRREPASGELDGPEHRILNALAWFEALGIREPLNTAVAFIAGYRAGGGAYNNPKARLRARQFVEYLPGDRMRITDAGRAHAETPTIPLTDVGLQEAVLAKLDGPEQRILRPLLPHGSEGLTADELAAAAGYTDGGGAFNNPKGRLRSLGLIDYGPGKRVFATSVLYPESN